MRANLVEYQTCLNSYFNYLNQLNSTEGGTGLRVVVFVREWMRVCSCVRACVFYGVNVLQSSDRFSGPTDEESN